MKLNATPRHYMPLSQNQSDDDESGPTKEDKGDKLGFKNSFDASEGISKDVRPSEAIEVDAKNLPMSPLRILMFILSLILCVLFIVVFVFFIPCTMPEDLDKMCHLTQKWETVVYNMSFTSPLDFVDTSLMRNDLIILGYVSDEAGVVAIERSTGKEYWRLPLHSTPSTSLCNIIDVNSDGIPDCLVLGSNGLLTAIDVKKGTSLWYLHNHSDLSEADSVYGPIIVPDCDNDGIEDIIVSYNISSEDSPVYLAVVSGGTGQIIGTFVELPQCTGPVTSQFAWESQNKTDVVLFCAGEKSGNLWLLSSKSICDVALNETGRLHYTNIFRVSHFKSIHFHKVTATGNHLVIILDGYKFLLLEKTNHSFQVVWKVTFGSSKHMRLLTDGEFVDGSIQLVVLNSYASHSKIVGLNVADGREMWSIKQGNGTVVSALKLPKFFNGSDGFILKVSNGPFTHEQPLNDKNSGNSSKLDRKISDEKHVFRNDIKLLEENYILIKYGKMPVMTTIHTEEVWSYCKGNVCQPDVYISSAAAVTAADTADTSYDLVTVTSTIPPVNSSQSVTEEVIIKYLNLRSVSSLQKCAR